MMPSMAPGMPSAMGGPVSLGLPSDGAGMRYMHPGLYSAPPG